MKVSMNLKKRNNMKTFFTDNCIFWPKLFKKTDLNFYDKLKKLLIVKIRILYINF